MVSTDLARSRLRTARDAANLLAPRFAGCAAEKLVVAHLDRMRGLIAITEVEGCKVDVALPVRRIVAEALAADGAGLILAHNHPSGDPSPSEADRQSTRILVEAAAPLGLIVHDHLIFANGECRSMRALGLL
jgi:DNA repair protein RadC